MSDFETTLGAIQAALLEVRVSTAADLDAYRLRFLGKKGLLKQLQESFRALDLEEKKKKSALFQKLKEEVQTRWKVWSHELSTRPSAPATPSADLSLPMRPPMGALHPLRLLSRKIHTIFRGLGFQMATGPEIETDWYNFTALNFEEHHPARDMQDTFFLTSSWLLRTHTSSVQARALARYGAPLRILSLGRVYRNETITARSHCVFHQVEGLYVDKQVRFVDMKGVLLHFVRALFGTDTKTRFRASYFPFTEPSAELDIACLLCAGKGCSLCKGSGWLEILGCGMVDPQVLRHSQVDPHAYSGYAFGLGLERMAMLMHGIPDLRLFTQNDKRFLEQFTGAR